MSDTIKYKDHVTTKWEEREVEVSIDELWEDWKDADTSIVKPLILLVRAKDAEIARLKAELKEVKEDRWCLRGDRIENCGEILTLREEIARLKAEVEKWKEEALSLQDECDNCIHKNSISRQDLRASLAAAEERGRELRGRAEKWYRKVGNYLAGTGFDKEFEQILLDR